MKFSIDKTSNTTVLRFDKSVYFYALSAEITTFSTIGSHISWISWTFTSSCPIRTICRLIVTILPTAATAIALITTLATTFVHIRRILLTFSISSPIATMLTFISTRWTWRWSCGGVWGWFCSWAICWNYTFAITIHFNRASVILNTVWLLKFQIFKNLLVTRSNDQSENFHREKLHWEFETVLGRKFVVLLWYWYYYELHCHQQVRWNLVSSSIA